MGVCGELVGGSREFPMMEEKVAASGFVGVVDDQVAGGERAVVELRDSFGGVAGETSERGDARTFAENDGATNVTVRFVHACEGLFKKNRKGGEAREFVAGICGEHSFCKGDFELRVGFFLRSGFPGDRGEGFAAFVGAALPEKYKSLLALSIEVVAWIVCELDGPVIFHSCVAEIAHESACAAKAFLRGPILGINFESRGVMLEGRGIVTGNPGNFPERVLGVGRRWFDCGVPIKG